MPAEFFDGTVLESEDNRFDGENIRRLYCSGDYPLARKPSDAPR
jgi:hypothetical protein